VRKALQGLSLPAGYSTKLAGQSAEQQTSFVALGQALGLSVLLTYMVTVTLYESFVTPFVVLLSLPLAAVGAILLMAITGSTLNLFSLIGFILLTGLVGKNAILLLDYTSTLRRQGLSRTEALLATGPIRLRPIIMTATALVVALLPVALGSGDGAELRRPIAIPVIGGIISSTLLTLVFIPAFYTVVDDFQLWIRQLFRRQPRILIEESAAAGNGRVVAVPSSDGESGAEEVAGHR
jgi:HAE1 family hydrophobic/amphiphilic exporter-1